jgi:hypothetical protein
MTASGAAVFFRQHGALHVAGATSVKICRLVPERGTFEDFDVARGAYPPGNEPVDIGALRKIKIDLRH